MPEFLTLLPPDEARAALLAHQSLPFREPEQIDAASSLGRVVAEDIHAPHALPEFPRSSMDGYAVLARDTFGASESLPGYLSLIGEVLMGAAPAFALKTGECALIHTGGMLPAGADAVVMLEYTQVTGRDGSPDEQGAAGDIGPPGKAPVGTEIEILKAVAEGENVIKAGEDVVAGQVILERGRVVRPAEIGGLMALGITELRVVQKPRVGLISSGDEVVAPQARPQPGQVRDVNAHTLGALITKAGGMPVQYGIVPDEMRLLELLAQRALRECDILVITAGSSASKRDLTAQVIDSLGPPGVLVHGVNTRPGKPTILGVCDGKAVIGLPGNPVSALVNGYLFLVPAVERLLGVLARPRPLVSARLTINLASQAGREDWWPVTLRPQILPGRQETYLAEPIFGKSNLIFTLAAADGLLRIPPDATGLNAGETVEVHLL